MSVTRLWCWSKISTLCLSSKSLSAYICRFTCVLGHNQQIQRGRSTFPEGEPQARAATTPGWWLSIMDLVVSVFFRERVFFFDLPFLKTHRPLPEAQFTSFRKGCVKIHPHSSASPSSLFNLLTLLHSLAAFSTSCQNRQVLSRFLEKCPKSFRTFVPVSLSNHSNCHQKDLNSNWLLLFNLKNKSLNQLFIILPSSTLWRAVAWKLSMNSETSSMTGLLLPILVYLSIYCL